MERDILKGIFKKAMFIFKDIDIGFASKNDMGNEDIDKGIDRGLDLSVGVGVGVSLMVVDVVSSEEGCVSSVIVGPAASLVAENAPALVMIERWMTFVESEVSEADGEDPVTRAWEAGGEVIERGWVVAEDSFFIVLVIILEEEEEEEFGGREGDGSVEEPVEGTLTAESLFAGDFDDDEDLVFLGES